MELAQGSGARALLWAGVLVAVAIAELLWPARPAGDASGRRWIGNLALYVLSSVLLMLPAATALGVAVLARASGAGILTWLALPDAAHAILALLALDAVQYGFHRLSHAIGPLWRLHAVHHSDAEVDVTTAIRHHPIEALVGSVVTAAAVYGLGASPGEVLAYAAIAWGVQALAHANLALPARLEAVLRRVLVTPEFHQVHHSRDAAETDSNYGAVLTIWDRMFRTASRRPAGAAILFGLDGFAAPRCLDPHWLLAQPFLPQGAERGAASPAKREKAGVAA